MLTLRDLNYDATLTFFKSEQKAKSAKFYALEEVATTDAPDLLEDLENYSSEPVNIFKRAQPVSSEKMLLTGTLVKNTVETMHIDFETGSENYDSV